MTALFRRRGQMERALVSLISDLYIMIIHKKRKKEKKKTLPSSIWKLICDGFK
jgi:hypothetical protein